MAGIKIDSLGTFLVFLLWMLFLAVGFIGLGLGWMILRVCLFIGQKCDWNNDTL